MKKIKKENKKQEKQEMIKEIETAGI